MTKTEYLNAITSRVIKSFNESNYNEQFKSEIHIGKIFENNLNMGGPVLTISNSDGEGRLYTIPYNERIVRDLPSFNSLELTTEQMNYITTIVYPFIERVEEYIEILYEAKVEEEEKDVDEENNNKYDDYEEKTEETYDEFEDYDIPFSSETSSMLMFAHNIHNEPNHTEEWYEDYDTDYLDEFTKIAKEWIKDNKNILNKSVEEIIDLIDFEELNNIYQNNELSFRETMVTTMGDFRVLVNPINEIPHETSRREIERETNNNWDNIKDNIYAICISTEEFYRGYDNIYKDVINETIGDIKVIYAIKEANNKYIFITNDMLYEWNKPIDTIVSVSKENIRNGLQSIDFSEGKAHTLYYLNDLDEDYGAGVITIMEDIAKNKDNHNLIIVPLSKKQIIVYDANTTSASYLLMIKHALYLTNKDELCNSEDFLSNNLYYYNSRTKTISILNEIDFINNKSNNYNVDEDYDDEENTQEYEEYE